MRVLIVRNAFSYDFGGAEKLAVFLAREIIDNGHEATVVTAHEKIADFARGLGIPAIRGWWWSKQNWSGRNILLTPLYVLWLVVLFIRYSLMVMSQKPDVLHLMSKDDFIAGTLAGRFLKKRVIWTDCADLKFLYQNIRSPLKNPVGKLVYAMSRQADTVTLVSQSEKHLIEQVLGAPRT